MTIPKQHGREGQGGRVAWVWIESVHLMPVFEAGERALLHEDVGRALITLTDELLGEGHVSFPPD